MNVCGGGSVGMIGLDAAIIQRTVSTEKYDKVSILCT